MLLSRVCDTDETARLYPLNSLRNYARLAARTQLVAMVDVDLLPSRSLSQDLARPEQ